MKPRSSVATLLVWTAWTTSTPIKVASCRRSLLLWKTSSFPDEVQRGVDDQLENRGSDDAAHHRCGDALHHVGAGALRPEAGNQADEDGRDRHHLGTDALDRAVHDGLARLVARSGFAFFPGEVEVEQHDDARLGIESRERNEPHPDGDRHVVAEQ